MAKRTKKRRRKSSLKSGSPIRRTARRSSGGRKRSFLSDLANPTVIMNGIKDGVQAAIGSEAGITIQKMMNPAASKLQKIFTILGVAVVGNMMGYPIMTAGAVGGMTATAFPGGLNDDDEASFADEDSLADKPLYTDSQGRPLVLEEGSNGASWRYLDDDEIQTLQDAGAFDAYQEVR